MSYRGWRRRRVLERTRISPQIWRDVSSHIPALRGLTDEELMRLRELVILFLHEKAIEGAAGVVPTDTMRLTIAAQACLPLLNLGLDWYEGWVSVIVYPDQFVTDHEYADETGVVHRTRDTLSGESWLRGPVILSWADIEPDAIRSGHNLIIHEFAHKLDALDGAVNGIPPLHRDMSVEAWSEAFSMAYANFRDRISRGERMPIDEYAGQDPGEFFAVLSEHFFESPLDIKETYPEVYRQLSAFYRQDPAARP